MTMLSFTNFTKGEIAPELQARIDTDQYAAGAKNITNFVIQKYGGLSFRPGFRLVGEVDDATKNIRFIPFQFNMDQAYVMALEDYNMRLLASGGFIVEDDVKITAITKAANAQITAANHGNNVGDRIFFSGISGMVQMNGRIGKILSVTTNTFTVNIDSRNFSTFTSSTGVTHSAPPPPPPPPPPSPPPAPPPPVPAPTGGGGGSGGGGGGDDGDGPLLGGGWRSTQ